MSPTQPPRPGGGDPRTQDRFCREWDAMDRAGREAWLARLDQPARQYLLRIVAGRPMLDMPSQAEPAPAATAPAGHRRTPAPAAASPARQRTTKDGRGRRPVVLTIKGSPTWKAWLLKAAEHHGVSTAELVERALASYVGEGGFDEQAPPR